MNKKLLKKMKEQREKRLEELKGKVTNGEIRAADLDAVNAEIDTIIEELQGIKDELGNDEDSSDEEDEEPAEEEKSSEEDDDEARDDDNTDEERGASLNPEQRDAIMGSISKGLNVRAKSTKKQLENQIRSAFANFIVGNINETQARSLGIEVGNGSVTVPDFLAREVITYSQEENFLRRLGTSVSTNENVKYPILVKKATAQGHKKERTGSDLIPETDVEFDEIELEPTEFDALATVTKKLLKRTGLPVEKIVMDELKKAYTRKETQYMVHGDEVGNINTGALAKKAVTFTPDPAETRLYDKLVSLKNTPLKTVRKKSRWVINTAALSLIEKMKTDDGLPLLNPLTQAQDGCNYKLLGHLVEEEDEITVEGKEDVPVFYFGDFSTFYVQDVNGSLELEVLRELFTNSNRVGFKLYSLLDAQLIYSPFEPSIFKFEVTGA
ncbi:phage major capsid protein [Listeria monocytogenes]|uniref:phage major capsid protein n=1 Tax=Listeria monocytogenes TaxID=1639 RepID=UPI001E62E942|nr:phage major capsid protein [Listeria monocytogenes]EJB8834726.1 phage major capsid protein [Listeria monocytogenes]MCD2228597.1 phage major capsid protein [Listeria monocytogenes]